MLDAFINAHLALIFTFILIILIYIFVNRYDQYKYRKNVTIFYIAYCSLITIGLFLHFMIYWSNDFIVKTAFFRARYIVWALAMFFGAGFSFNFLKENSFTFQSKKFYIILTIITGAIILSFFLNFGGDFADFNVENPVSFIMILTFYFLLSGVAIIIPIQLFKYTYIQWKKGNDIYRPLSMATAFLIGILVVNIFALLRMITITTIGTFFVHLWIFINFLGEKDLNILLKESFEELMRDSERNRITNKQFELFRDQIKSQDQILIEYQNISNKFDFEEKLLSDFLSSNIIILVFLPKGRSKKLIKKLENKENAKLMQFFEYSTTNNSVEKVKFNNINITLLSIDLSILLESIAITMEESKKRNENLLIIFDSITELINWYDFNKTYRFIKKLIDRFNENQSITSVFFINENSHEEKVKSSLRIIFDKVLKET